MAIRPGIVGDVFLREKGYKNENNWTIFDFGSSCLFAEHNEDLFAEHNED